MNTLYLKTLTLKVPVRYIISQQHKLLVYVFIGLHCVLPQAATRVQMFCKKSVFKNFVNFIGKHLRWRLFLIIAGLTPILKNICQILLLRCAQTTHCYLSVLLYIQHLLPHHHCYYSETIVRRCSIKKKVFLEILQNSQKDTCVTVSFLIKLQGLGLHLY